MTLHPLTYTEPVKTLKEWVIVGHCMITYGSFNNHSEAMYYADALKESRSLDCRVVHKSEVSLGKH